MKRWFAFLLMFILAVALVGCDNENGNGEKKEPSTYTITYNLNGGSLSGAKTKFTKDELPITLPTPTKNNAEFLGWYLNPNFTGEPVTQINEAKNVTVYAKWSDGEVVKSKLDLFKAEERPDLGGMKVRIMAAGHALYEHDPFDPQYTAADKEAKQLAWELIEELFNIELEVVAYPDDAPWGPQRISYINDASTRGTHEAEFYTIASEWVPQFARANSVVNLDQMYREFGRGVINNAVRQSLSYKSELYALSNADGGVYSGFFYNYKLIKDLNVQSPAEIFMKGEWTYERFVEYIIDIQNKLPSVLPQDTVGYAIAGEPVYVWTGMVNAAGIKMMDVDNLQLNLLDPVAEQAYNALRQLGEAGAIDPAGGYDASNEKFKAGHAVFSYGELWFLKADNRWLDIWGKGTTEWGYVPFPRPANVDVEKTRTSFPGAQSYVIPRNLKLPQNVTEEDLFRVMIDYFYATQLYREEEDGYNPELDLEVYFESLVHDRYSVQALMYLSDGRVFFDPLSSTAPHYNTGLGTAIRTLVLSGGDFREKITPIVQTITENFMIPSWGG